MDEQMKQPEQEIQPAQESPLGQEDQLEQKSQEEQENQTQVPVKSPSVPNPEPKPGQEKGKKLRNTNKWKRGGMATLLSVIFIAIVVALNIVVSALSDRFPSMNIDLTAQKMNSLSDQAEEIAKGVKNETTIYLIGSRDAYEKDQLYSSYGLKYSQVMNLAERLKEANAKIKVQFVDPDTNPEFLSEYAAESLTSGKVLVKTEKRYKVLSVSDMYSITQNSMTGGRESFSMVDSALASALEMVNLDKVPVVTIATGHEELLNSEYLSTFTQMMEEENFAVQEIDFMTEEIPEDTQILMIPTPTTDYTEEELQKLRDYLGDETREEPLTLLVTAHPTEGDLPKLHSFLEEWGVKVEAGMVAETDSSRAVGNASYVVVDPSEELLSENSYDRILAPSSSPLTLVFDANNDITTRALWTTSDGACVLTEDLTEEEAEDPETAQQTLATFSTKLVQQGNGTVNRSVIVFGSSYAFTDTFLGTSAFGNRAYVEDLMKYATGTDGSAVTVQTEKVQTNVMDITAPRSTVALLGILFTVGVPLAILVAGLVIFLKRRHL